MSRIESGKIILAKEPFSCKDMIDDINAMIASQTKLKHIHYQFINSVQNDHFFRGDETRIKQILLNLLNNAIKFTADGGTVRLQYEVLTVMNGKGRIRFTVSDSGIGISKEFLKRIFEKVPRSDLLQEMLPELVSMERAASLDSSFAQQRSRRSSRWNHPSGRRPRRS